MMLGYTFGHAPGHPCPAPAQREARLAAWCWSAFRCRCHVLQAFRHQVHSALGRSHIMWHFSRDALEEAGARHSPPFAVISSNTMDLATGRWDGGGWGP